MYSKKLKRWEFALLIGLASAMLWASALGGAQDALAEQVVRLHVVANSDSEADQALKLKVRDAVLAEATPYLAGLDRQAALNALEELLPSLAGAAARVVGEQGYDYSVTASLQEERFPTKRYEGLPCLLESTWRCGCRLAAAADITGGAWCFRPCVWAAWKRPPSWMTGTAPSSPGRLRAMW